MKSIYCFVFLFLISVIAFSQKTTKTENVILITLDGMRWQEVFAGADPLLIRDKTFVSDSSAINKKYWNETVEKRREILFPFFWSTIAKKGQLYGNRTAGSKVNVSNNQWFSYPGYNEILCGFADNDRIHSNDKLENPNKTVLEFINAQKDFTGKVAAYSSWDVFPYIINTKRSGIPVNGGIVQAKGEINERERFMNELMYEVPNPLGDVRLDAFTFHYAFEYLKRNKPRVLYIAFDETDDFAHGGKYDLYLESAHYEDQLINNLWQWIQSDTQYKDKTTLIITADHGRGHHDSEAWKSHGAKMPDSDQIWMAVMGPDSPALGEVKQGQLYQNQIAKTMASLLGLNYTNEKQPGNEIVSIVKSK